MEGMVTIITGVSGSGKTTLANMLKERGGIEKELNFTTRQPRSDAELDEYVFLTKDQFESKIRNGDFCEFTYYNGNYYGMTRFLDRNKNYVLVMEPAGRAMIEKWLLINGFNYRKVFIDIDKKTVIHRLKTRGENEETIRNRLEDFLYFFPDNSSIVLDGKKSKEDVMDEFISLCYS